MVFNLCTLWHNSIFCPKNAITRHSYLLPILNCAPKIFNFDYLNFWTAKGVLFQCADFGTKSPLFSGNLRDRSNHIRDWSIEADSWHPNLRVSETHCHHVLWVVPRIVLCQPQERFLFKWNASSNLYGIWQTFFISLPFRIPQCLKITLVKIRKLS